MTTDLDSKIFDHSLCIARRILPFMGEKRIPATPENYMIFYLYFEADSPTVVHVVKEQLDSGEPWTAQTTQRIFSQLFSSEANLSLHRFNERLAAEIRTLTEDIMAETRATAMAAAQSGRRLDESIARTEEVQDRQQLTDWLQTVIAEVGRVKETSHHLGERLEEKTERLDGVVTSLKHLEYIALTDELTQLPNRRAWDQRLKAEFNRFLRHPRPTAVIILDLDLFKRLNDNFGHLVGDQALREVAKVLIRSLRTIDVAARFGGEEFVLLLPETNLPQGVAVAERIRQSLAQTKFTVKDLPVAITASFGVAALQNGDPGPEEALERADQALYLAKSKGRNQVRHEGELPAPARQAAS